MKVIIIYYISTINFKSTCMLEIEEEKTLSKEWVYKSPPVFKGPLPTVQLRKKLILISQR